MSVTPDDRSASLAGADAPATTDDVAAAVADVCAAHGDRPDALIEMLHAIQARLGHVPPQAEPLIAARLNRSRAEIHGVVSFYHDFHTAPAGRRVIKLCRAEACQAVGCEDLANHLHRAHRLGSGATTPDAAVTVEDAYCLGNCALGPAALVDGELQGRVTAERLDRWIAEARIPRGEAAE
ncbi:NAD(P)H-dependent oxidoreductase subunit E [Amorphus orientalis]|uniref:Formate dehydrogenase subunit gamma n=1 Tax=Amorphus orientalis TaxID=649198 RepID=A0AAE3VQI2_9HYPH|nr:NAD(P)H-dependent oxidoreductase subunit E [Amorphus orientalis]MDQ0316000.1 formate dehydrogenase subunit gamma [Amorphus orientalis]